MTSSHTLSSIVLEQRLYQAVTLVQIIGAMLWASCKWNKSKIRKLFIIFVLITTGLFSISLWIEQNCLSAPVSYKSLDLSHNLNEWPYVSSSLYEGMSVLSRHVYLSAPLPPPRIYRNFTILTWREGDYLSNRWIPAHGDPFSQCSVSNCRISYDEDEKSVISADAVVFHLHRMPGPSDIPKWRNLNQRWIFFTEESPFHPFAGSAVGYWRKTSDYNTLFNWSLHYRMDADIPVPYGRAVSLTETEKTKVNISKIYAIAKTKMVAAMGSNCQMINNNRWKYVQKLQRYIQVDVYGQCGTFKCDGRYTSDCPLLNPYKFYLAFENGNCKEYITEKVWLNALSKDTIPIVMGPPRSDYEIHLPPHSFIHVDDFDGPKELAYYLRYLVVNQQEYNKFLAWKQHFKVVQEHGYFGMVSMHYCRICEALNYNDESRKVYEKLEKYWNPLVHCSVPPWYQMYVTC